MSSEVGSRIAKNSIFNFLRTFLGIPITLLISPFIIVHLGKEEFGVWALVGVISSYASLSDFGITESLIKFMAEFKARDDTVRLNQLINTALTVYVVLSIVFCFLFIQVLPFIVIRILSIPAILQEKAIYVFTIAIILFFLNMVMGVFGSLIVGFQRMGYSNLIGLIQTVMMACGTFLFISNGYGLPGLVYNNAIITVFVIISNVFVARRLFPAMVVNPYKYFNREILAKIFGFSWKVQLTNITQLMVFQLDRILLSHFLGLTAVAYYELANRIATQARSFVASIFGPMVPAASELHATAVQGKIAGLYRRSIRYLSAIAIPFLILIAILSPAFVTTWLGAGYETTANTLSSLCLIYLLLLFTGPGSMILSGIGKPEVSMRTSIIAGISNLVLCFVLVRSIGYYGLVIGIGISIVVSGGYFIFLVHRNIEGLDVKLYFASIAKPLAVSLIMSLIIYILSKIVPLRGYPVLFSISSLYVFIYSVVLYYGNYFDDFDKKMLQRVNPVFYFNKCK